MKKISFGRYDYAGFSAFCAYAICSLAIPLAIVEMGKDLAFPLDKGGMASGGVLHLVRSIAMVLALLFCGILTGRLGKRLSMGLAMLLMGCGILFCSLAPCYALLLPFLLLAGCGEGICEGAATPFVQGLHKDEAERYVNIAHSMWSVGIGAAVLIVGVLLTGGISWRFILAGCGCLGLLSVILFLWKEKAGHEYPEPEQKEKVSDIWRHTVAIGKCGRFWFYCLGMFMGAGAEFCLTFWSAAYLRLNFDASAMVAGLGTGAIALGMFAGRLGVGFFAKKQYLKHVLLVWSLGTVPLTLLLAFLKGPMFPSRIVMFAVLLFILFLCGIGIAPYWPTLQVYGVDQLPELDSTMLYIYFSAIGIPGCGTFTWVMGILGDKFGLGGAFLMIPVSLILFASVIFIEGWIFPRKAVNA